MKKLREFTILIVDDEPNVISALQRSFARYNYHILTALNGKDALELLTTAPVDLLILDLKMPVMDGVAVLQKVRLLIPDLKVIIHTGHGGVAEAVEALKQGASDFLEKGCSPEILRARVGQMYEMWLLDQKTKELSSEVANTFLFEELVGESQKIARLKSMIVKVAPTDTTVLIQGESGTGKELIARAIHYQSNRAQHAFVVVDCASISETVIESELFGHVKGAFTGATSTALGLIRSADKGTLFLDEIGELSVGLQAKFLRTIQERLVRPVGSTTNHPVDIRIVAATNRNLLDETSTGKFRQDLYYRLSTVTLTSPPLRERDGDIDLLTEHILNDSKEQIDNNVNVTAEAMAIIRNYDWPGNVRELENVLKGALVFADNFTVKPEDLPPILGGVKRTDENTGIAGTLASCEREAIKKALDQTDDNRRKAAEILDISEATLYRKIKMYLLS